MVCPFKDDIITLLLPGAVFGPIIGNVITQLPTGLEDRFKDFKFIDVILIVYPANPVGIGQIGYNNG